MNGSRRAMAIGGALLAAVALIDVDLTNPPVHVRWRPDVSVADRLTAERRYSLASGEPLEDETWRYVLANRSRENVRALVEDTAVDDTANIDRTTFTPPARALHGRVRGLSFLTRVPPTQWLQPQSILLIVAGTVLLLAGALAEWRHRRLVTVVALAGIAVFAYALPLDQPIRMGDSGTYVSNRALFENYNGVKQIRFEAHLSYAILGRVDRVLGRRPDSPAQAFEALMRAATALFVLSAMLVLVLERWSPAAIRYVGLVLLAPASLLYFGYRELGHLSLNVAAFPLLIGGLQRMSQRLDAAGALLGLSAAFHGFGLLSLAGAWLATWATRLRLRERLSVSLRLAGCGGLFYLGWIAAYVLVLRLPIVAGHAAAIPLRPLAVDAISDRVNAAILSPTGLRDVTFTLWVVGAPLLALAASLWRERAADVRAMLLYAIPSALFVVMFWPVQGLAVEMDLVFAAFPALYACAWVCAQERRRAWIAAALLVSAHVAFWRIVLNDDFVNSRI